MELLFLSVVLLLTFIFYFVQDVPFYFVLEKLALTSPTGGGRSVGIVRSRTKATEFSLVFSWKNHLDLCH